MKFQGIDNGIKNFELTMLGDFCSNRPTEFSVKVNGKEGERTIQLSVSRFDISPTLDIWETTNALRASEYLSDEGTLVSTTASDGKFYEIGSQSYHNLSARGGVTLATPNSF